MEDGRGQGEERPEDREPSAAPDERTEAPASGSERRDPRLAIILGGVTVLVLGVVAVLAAGGGGDSAEAAPAECIESWNTDRDANLYGRHNYGAHGYDRVQVTYLSRSAEELADADREAGRGVCAVIFGALELDEEPDAAGQLLVDGTWTPIVFRPGVELTRVAELQAIAAGEANASLDGDGKLAAK